VRVLRSVSSPEGGEGDREAVEGRLAASLIRDPSTTFRVVPLSTVWGGDRP
jgi:hypothetical protein